MTLYTKLNKDLTGVISEIEDYLSSQAISESYARAPFYEIDSLVGVPSLEEIFDGLTIKSSSIYTIWYQPVASFLTAPYAIIPLRSYDNMSLKIHELKDNAQLNSQSDVKYPFYLISETDEVEAIPFQDNTVYFINSNVIHSFQYNEADPLYIPNLGTYLVLSFNEDISSYFS